MNLSDLLANAPDDLTVSISLTVGELRTLLAARPHPLREYTPRQAADQFGHSPNWWREHAAEVEGARQDARGGWWLPQRGIEEYLLALKDAGVREEHVRRRARGPRLRRVK